ncbi:MAG: hypothetical protein A3D94_02100 [Alphaproteobacteria bacterium RIFCSPHIGHO2_12_FULL_66_14]|jgi:hypothetical protein|nr:MAG: hypothetical protein A3D94_02100 [Alphaproteobacteria bacterium RIFCSPHIGHO2_12_FULL_66_14]
MTSVIDAYLVDPQVSLLDKTRIQAQVLVPVLRAVRAELAALLICEADFDIAAAGEGEVSLERTQTIMRGASNCIFRYKFAQW